VSSAPPNDPGSASRPRRLLILAEGYSADPHYGKTARGVLRYRREQVVAILDSERAGETQDGIPIVGSVNDALCFNPTTALVGVATQGGRFPPAWRELLKSAIAKGLDVENGLHELISEDPELVELAARHRVELRDLRKPPPGLNVPTGENLTHPAKVVLTVGSDCAIGKMTVALELDAEACRRGIASEFVPTGQTGIAIAGWGISVDAVVSDFAAGAIENEVIEAGREAEVVVVEGQGALHHPGYSGVTLSLLAGSCPRALILCHAAGRDRIRTAEGSPREIPIPPLAELARAYETAAAWVQKAEVVGVALNTLGLEEPAARAACEAAGRELGVPATDPVRFGARPLAQAVLALRGRKLAPQA